MALKADAQYHFPINTNNEKTIEALKKTVLWIKYFCELNNAHLETQCKVGSEFECRR